MSKFKVGDNVVRVKCSHSKCSIGYVGKVTSVRGCWVSVDEITSAEDLHPFSEDFFELYEEKQMFDMKKTPWYVNINNEEESKAFQAWAFENGLIWCNGRAVYVDTQSTTSYPTNIGSDYPNKSVMCYNINLSTGNRKLIKLNFKTTIDSVEYPEIMTEKEIETKKIREEMEALAERLKKLEGN